jgi:hypothetical protein
MKRSSPRIALIVRPAVLLWLLAVAAVTAQPAAGLTQPAQKPKLLAGASAVNIGPRAFPVIVNGGFLQAKATRLKDTLEAKALVLDDGATRIAIVVVDTCMMPRELIDKAKELARAKSGIAVERMLISATHTHSAPAAMGALGCPPDQAYAAELPAWIAESIIKAVGNLEPARAGSAKIDDAEHTHCRRWIRWPEKLIDDPFGQKTVRANMHPGYQNPDAIAPSGPVDPALTVLSVQSLTGRPIAVLANYTMHNYGVEAVSSDYFGRFAKVLSDKLASKSAGPPFVALMSQGTSGDQMWMDYGKPAGKDDVDAYAAAVAKSALKAYETITYSDSVPLASAEKTLTLGRRVPDQTRLKWARELVNRINARDGMPRTEPEVYALEAIYLHDQPQRELKLQAFRIGELGITAIPNEVFALTGLKLKARSPFGLTMNIELANGSEGYIPPPEQHALGGYTTWPARTAALEVEAEPKIVATVLGLLEQVAGKPRRVESVPSDRYSESVLASKPYAYWRLDEMEGWTAHDSSGHGHDATFEPGVAFYLPGVELAGRGNEGAINRAVHFAGGRLKAPWSGAKTEYSVELWFWSGVPNDVRVPVDFLLQLAFDKAGGLTGDLVGLGGNESRTPGQIRFVGATPPGAVGGPAGRSVIAPKAWRQLALTRKGARVEVYLDATREIEFQSERHTETDAEVYIGSLWGNGRRDGFGFQGKIDEVSIYDRALDPAEITSHYAAAR